MQPAIGWLIDLISIPSLSRKEDKTADYLEQVLSQFDGVKVFRHKNNVWAQTKNYDPSKKNVLLNSHHDTVKPASTYTRDPYKGDVAGDQLFGLGSNDAGASLVSLLATFLHFVELPTKYNLIFAASAEEEVSGKDGMEDLLKVLPEIYFGIVGEPTQMRAAIAEKGLMVIDAKCTGVSGHAARDEGENAIYKAIKDVALIESLDLGENSKWLGPIKATVSLINAGTQHNVVPDLCTYTIDVRSTDRFGNEELLEILRGKLNAELTPRSTRLNPSGIEEGHELVKAAKLLGRELYGSPTLSDQALMSFPTIKMGPGKSARSHTADEFVLISEIEEGIKLYIRLLEEIL